MPCIYWYLGADLLVRAPDCGSGSRRFEPDLPPLRDSFESLFLYGLINCFLTKKSIF